MEKVPYLTKTAVIKEFLNKIQETGTPTKVSQEYLESIGFTSSNDRPLVPLFKFLGFLDSSGVPTGIYKKYRNKKEAPRVLASAIRGAYLGLFSTYPDAYRKDDEALADYFRTSTGLGERSVSALVNTFKKLCENGDFAGVPGSAEEVGDEEGTVPEVKKRKVVPGMLSPEIVINIQLQLPPSDKEEVYDKLFASLRKNLILPCTEEK